MMEDENKSYNKIGYYEMWNASAYEREQQQKKNAMIWYLIVQF